MEAWSKYGIWYRNDGDIVKIGIEEIKNDQFVKEEVTTYMVWFNYKNMSKILKMG